jgi:hypothetical protein
VHSTYSTKTGAVKEGTNQSCGDVKVNRGAVGEWTKVNNVTGIATNLSYSRITNINDVPRRGINGDDTGFAEKD